MCSIHVIISESVVCALKRPTFDDSGLCYHTNTNLHAHTQTCNADYNIVQNRFIPDTINSELGADVQYTQTAALYVCVWTQHLYIL